MIEAAKVLGHRYSYKTCIVTRESKTVILDALEWSCLKIKLSKMVEGLEIDHVRLKSASRENLNTRPPTISGHTFKIANQHSVGNVGTVIAESTG